MNKIQLCTYVQSNLKASWQQSEKLAWDPDRTRQMILTEQDMRFWQNKTNYLRFKVSGYSLTNLVKLESNLKGISSGKGSTFFHSLLYANLAHWLRIFSLCRAQHQRIYIASLNWWGKIASSYYVTRNICATLDSAPQKILI